MNFQTIHTTYGLQRIAAAEAQGVSINLVEMAVGDGGGNPTAPSEAQTSLVREMYRAAVNRVFQDPVIPTKFTAEIVIPATIGGFTQREVGIFDADGRLFAVGNLPATYKPNISEGAYSDTVIRMEFMVQNASIITLAIDPNVAVATRAWITSTITPAFLLPGGTTHQVLRKRSNAEGDTEWAEPSDVNVLVNTIEESQTLAANQTVVNLAITNTTGLAVYVAGDRLPNTATTDGWQRDIAVITRLTLGKAYAAGTKIICVQNEPASSLPDALSKPQNLADLPNKATARTNLGVFSKEEANQLTPTSAIMYFPRTTAPTGWLKANGAAISRVAYATLYAVIGTTFGDGNGFDTFNLPDLRGEFLRGWDDGRGIDAGRALNTRQAGDIMSHSHGASADAQGVHSHTGGTDAIADHNHTGTTAESGFHGHGAQIVSAGAHQHDSGWGESGNHAPYGVARTNVYGSGQSDSDNQSFLTSIAGEHTHGLNIDANGTHSHSFRSDAGGGHSHRLNTDNSGQHAHNISVAAAGGSETRPRNMALLACIKY